MTNLGHALIIIKDNDLASRCRVEAHGGGYRTSIKSSQKFRTPFVYFLCFFLKKTQHTEAASGNEQSLGVGKGKKGDVGAGLGSATLTAYIYTGEVRLGQRFQCLILRITCRIITTKRSLGYLSTSEQLHQNFWNWCPEAWIFQCFPGYS